MTEKSTAKDKKKFRQIFSFQKLKSNYYRIKRWVNEILSFAIKFISLLSIVFLSVIIINGVFQTTYTIEPFQIPKSFEDDGYNGGILTSRILEWGEQMKRDVQSSKKNSWGDLVKNESTPDIKVIGLGISLDQLVRYLKKVMGRENKTITGWVTIEDSSLIMTVKETGNPAIVIQYSLRGVSRYNALDILIENAAVLIMKMLEPHVLADYYFEQGDCERCQTLVHHTLNKYPENQELDHLYIYLGVCLTEIGKYDEAMVQYNNVIEKNPDWATPLAMAAYTLQQQGNFAEAIEKCEQAISIESIPYAWGVYGDILYDKSKYDDAINKYKNSIKADSNYAFSWTSWGNALYAKTEYSMAIEKYEVAVNIDPYMESAWVNWGNVLAFLEKYEDEIEKYTKAVKFDANDVNVWSQLGYAFSKLGNHEKAIESYNNALGLDSSDAELNNNIAYSYELNRNYDMALKYAQRALEIDSTYALAYSTLAELAAIISNNEEFYQNLDLALKYGFEVWDYIEYDPYSRYKEEAKFLELIEKYE